MEMKHFTMQSFGEQLSLPLPGIYPILTWQLNVTVHQASGLLKAVSVIREPNDHVEVARFKLDLEEYHGAKYHVLASCDEAIIGLGYLSGLSKGI